MIALRHALVLAAAAALLACAQDVSFSAVDDADLAACRTWAWLPPEHAIPADLDALLRGAVAGELAGRGLERAREGEPPCLRVGYELALRQEIVMRTETGAQQRLETFGSGGGGASGMPAAFEVIGSARRAVPYEAGTLVVAVADGAGRRTLWRAVWTGRARDGLGPQLEQAVEELFTRFPAGPATPQR